MENVEQRYSITTPYDFPVAPGDKEWANFSTTQEMIDATQVPEDILKNTTTRALIETMLSNPFILEFQCCEDSMYVFEMLEKNFNVFRELQLRSDYREELLNLYESKNLVTASELESNNGSTHFFDVFNLEVLIAHEMEKKTDVSKQIADYEITMDKVKKLYEKC